MKHRILYLLPLLLFLAACSKGEEEEKKLYPTKVVVGNTTHDFHYDAGRLYSVTTTRPGFYEEVTYRYYDDYFNKPEHRLKNEIIEVNYVPDLGPIGWDRSDSVKSRQEMFIQRSESDMVTYERQNVYLPNLSVSDFIRHKYDEEKRLTKSVYYFYDTSFWNNSDSIKNDPKYISKQVKYDYKNGKLTKAAFYGSVSRKPYLVVELEYDESPGHLKHLPREARFLPLELPYRDHNITRYTFKDRYGKVRKDMSYTCEFSYNKDGYPDKFTRRMLDGKEVKGYILYKAEGDDKKGVAFVQE